MTVNEKGGAESAPRGEARPAPQQADGPTGLSVLLRVLALFVGIPMALMLLLKLVLQ